MAPFSGPKIQENPFLPTSFANPRFLQINGLKLRTTFMWDAGRVPRCQWQFAEMSKALVQSASDWKSNYPLANWNRSSNQNCLQWGRSNSVDPAVSPKIRLLNRDFGNMLSILPRENSKTLSSLNFLQPGPPKFTKSEFSGLAPVRRVLTQTHTNPHSPVWEGWNDTDQTHLNL